ncbi:hypothetical protein Tco_0481826 [Tanacetum coccineum]
MSNANNNLQTQISNALHNAIMEAGGKDRPPMLAPGNYVQWKSRIKRYIYTKPNNELIHYCLQNPPYKFKWTRKTVPVTKGIDNDIYSIVDACPNACEMWKAIEMLKQGESINVQDLKTNLYWEFRKFTSRDGESLESYYSRSQQVATRNRVKAIVKSPSPTYDQEPTMVSKDDEMSKEKDSDKLMALISLSFKKIYKPTNNNLRTSSNISRANHDNTPRINKGIAYDNQRVVYIVVDRENAAGIQLSVEQADWRDDTDDEPKDQELEAHYLYMAHIQEVNPDTAKNSGPIFDAEPFNFVEKFLGAVKFGNDQIATILDYGDMVQRNGNDLLTCSRGTDLYSITLQDTSTSNPICLMAKATSSQA